MTMTTVWAAEGAGGGDTAVHALGGADVTAGTPDDRA
jgi:hypothetical protein